MSLGGSVVTDINFWKLSNKIDKIAKNQEVIIKMLLEMRPKPKKRLQPKYNEDDLTLASRLAKTVNSVSFKSWAEDIRLMREVDKKTHAEIEVEWHRAQRHPFWAKNIKSANKLRQHWGKFDEANNTGNSKTSLASQFSDTANTNF